ncbi:TIGR02757 family protein [Helicobacter sp. MIT 05-5293]|uniref:TIGR02757 family protein n=1 Tax=Helicobacter sp. MIT 05-5293 TaxID=1548149 RepID=UPI00068BF611|nr:TIGR02757 family protein [Helicobacter sp. MIT 05-5293]TLD80965.1 TIGR02757 family protein [Helicobacter sp. MIT 05-5293]
MQTLKALLEFHYHQRNCADELSLSRPDPLWVAKNYTQSPYFDEIALICALLSYGNAKMIVQTLQKLDFSLLESPQLNTIDSAEFPYYRFQTACDIREIFIIMSKIIAQGGIKQYFVDSYKHTPKYLLKSWNLSSNPTHCRMIFAIFSCIQKLRSLQTYASKGLDFLIGKPFVFDSPYTQKLKNTSPLKRWNMYLRWLVRCDEIDMGFWNDQIQPSSLILPLDTHTFALCHQLKILSRKSYDLQSALMATDSLIKIDKDDPIKYDFALYRLGQFKILS